jgi:hypothetical protein
MPSSTCGVLFTGFSETTCGWPIPPARLTPAQPEVVEVEVVEVEVVEPEVAEVEACA